MVVPDAVNWLNSQIGQHDDFDGVYGTQCVDFFNFYYRYLTGRNPYGDGLAVPGACDIWNVPTQYFTKVANNPNDPNQLPPQGSIIFWAGNMPGSGGHGHVAVVDRADANNLLVWEEVPGSNVQHIVRRWSSPSQHWELGWWIFNGFAPSDPAPALPVIPVAPPKPPDAPLTVPNSLDPYLVVKDIPGYLSPGQAIAHATPANTTVPEGTYMIYDRKSNMINVTMTAGKSGWWINPLDNVVTPPAATVSTGYVSPRESSNQPAPIVDVNSWKSTYRVFVDRSGQRSPVKYVALENYIVHDIAGQRRDLPLHQYDYVIVGGTFKRDDIIYARPQQAADNQLWYGIPLNSPEDGDIIEPYDRLYSAKTTTAERQALHEETIYDYLVLAYERLSKVLSAINIFKKA